MVPEPVMEKPKSDAVGWAFLIFMVSCILATICIHTTREAVNGSWRKDLINNGMAQFVVDPQTGHTEFVYIKDDK